MKLKSKEKRVININKEDFDTIKEYCNANAFNMPKWLSKLAIDYINKQVEKTIKKMETK
jgi:hypothetical protein